MSTEDEPLDPRDLLDTQTETHLDENAVAELIESIKEAQYFDPTSMAPLTSASLAAIARLRAYQPPPFATWNRLPLSRRAAVLILLFADRRGDLRVVITMRAMSLRNFSGNGTGHAAFPGGKADTLEETPFEIARREAFEEIGLPQDDKKLPPPFRVEHLCELPYNLARTALAVRPCVAFLHSDDTSGMKSASVEESMIPRLDAKEVAAVFSAPFHNFLRAEDEVRDNETVPGKRSDWYSGSWSDWNKTRWRMHDFQVPIVNQMVSKPKSRDGGQAAISEELDHEELTRYRVWGMTARILVDAARIAYGEDPEFEFNTHLGDERMIENLEKMGQMKEKKLGGPDLSRTDLEEASKKTAAELRKSDAKM
ncbi:hypothetical protein BP5796_07462 [Coleophoma crateriformis]|uniref:Nudix hydrolase domain-containing protein n=1 Tax=Coleophoma crateriformis TaxID=565419 RepID=A0A3D8RJ70_9HELO|nr:hypothetical protein BP5796_07462 [Coleophoma crateriformis]